MEVLALKVPFRNLQIVSESSPVAGTIENSAFSENLDAGRTREIHTNTTGCHTSALGELFIPDEREKLQGGI